MGDLPKEVTRITRPDANKHLTNIQNVSGDRIDSI